MRVLIIKTSSMGDIVHTLPALTDARCAIPDIVFDWVVEEDFADIPKLHPAVQQVIPIALRRWRKNIVKTLTSSEWKIFRQQLNQQTYDMVIDAQGLLKSAWLVKLVASKSVGLDKHSAREPLASFFYDKKIDVQKGIHAIERVRQLFAKALNYELPSTLGDYGINAKTITQSKTNRILFFHGTTWATKLWPSHYWQELSQLLQAHNFSTAAPWSNQIERQRVAQLSEAGVIGLGALTLPELIKHIAAAKAVVSVDSGLGHLAAALNIPTVFLYGPTNPALTGGYGVADTSLASQFACAPCLQEKCAYRGNKILTSTSLHGEVAVAPPCFAEITPDRVKTALLNLIEQTTSRAGI